MANHNKRYKNISGQKFNKLLVLSYAHTDKHDKACWNCRCECGKELIIPSNRLKYRSFSCGCVSRLEASTEAGCVKCTTCSTDKFPEKMSYHLGRVTHTCLDCFRLQSREKRRALPPRERRKLNQYNAKQTKLKRESITDEAQLVVMWAKRCLSHKGRKEGYFSTRALLTIDDLIRLAEHAKKIFPYIIFSGRGKREFFASLDRIDSTRGYELENVQIIPYWLNVAKCKLTMFELRELMRDFLKDD